MTDLRKAAEMALEVLEADREHITYESAVYSAALALRQALAQPDDIQAAVLAEREACIDIVARHGGSVEIEAAIKARGDKHD